MIIATYDVENQQINSNTAAFGCTVQYIKSWEDITTKDIIFCIDKQTADEVANLYFVNPLKTFSHNNYATYVFGENNKQKLAREIISCMERNTKTVSLLSISNKTLWAESAMAIVLYDLESKET
jgi:hypothetical protein